MPHPALAPAPPPALAAPPRPAPRRATPRAALAACAALGALGCGAAPPAAESAAAGGLLCSIFVCGDNAPVTGDGFIFDELHLAGEPNHAGVRLLGATGPGGEPAELHVARDAFYTVNVDGKVREGAWLVGTTVQLEHASGEAFELLFAGFNGTSIPFLAGAPAEVPTYELKVRRAGEAEFQRFACNDDAIALDPPWAGLPHHALVYRGDRYHPKERRVIESDPEGPWIFLACAGSAAAKLHLYRHTEAAGAHDDDGDGTGDYPTGIDQRTTLLKAITADYCGDGRGRFTVLGQPLRWATDQPWWPDTPMPPVAPGELEAIWGADGALCLDEPRRVSRAKVESVCGHAIPWCGSGEGWQGTGYAVTASP